MVRPRTTCLLVIVSVVSACFVWQLGKNGGYSGLVPSKLFLGQIKNPLVVPAAAAPASQSIEKLSAHSGVKVVYGLFTSAGETYRKKLVATLESWGARPRKEGRLQVIVGTEYPDAWLEPEVVIKSNCTDAYKGLPCREAVNFIEAFRRGADWIVIVGEDNYVNTELVDSSLQSVNSKFIGSAATFGALGCGMGLKFCEAVTKKSGFCGGNGYVINREALKLLLKDGPEAMITRFRSHEDVRWPNDMTTSCELMAAGVTLSPFDHLHDFRTTGNPHFPLRDYETFLQDRYAILHPFTAELLRWYHARMIGSPANVTKPLEDAAFDRRCARGMDTPWWHNLLVNCQQAAGAEAGVS